MAMWTPVVPVAYSFWPKYSGGPDSIEVIFDEVPYLNQYQDNERLIDSSWRWKGTIKPKNCWSLAKYNSDTLKEFSELIVCRDKDNPSKPNVYFYKLDKLVPSPEKNIQYAKKVIDFNLKIEEFNNQKDQYLEINLVENQKEKMKLSSVTGWANVKDLNPYRECRLIETVDKNVLMVCEFTRFKHSFFIPFKLNLDF